MADSKQCSDYAQTGPGFSTAFKPKDPYVAAPKPTASSPSGQTQSETRGTDNKAK